MGLFKKIRDGFKKTRDSISDHIDSLSRSFSKIDEDLLDELQESLILSDVGVETSLLICDLVRKKVKENKAYESSALKIVLQDVIAEIMTPDTPLYFEKGELSVILIIGVNGVGKTTTIGKLANMFKENRKNVVLAAADTFRAAAIEQLDEWANRSGVDLIKHQSGSDPSAVVFDALDYAKSNNADILIIDTAGRLHNKKNLMSELSKINRIIEKQISPENVQKFLVLDATTGQNAIVQAKQFNEATEITGVILTKLDGTAKGGILISIKNELNIPVRFVGVGESIDDLQDFDSSQYLKSIF